MSLTTAATIPTTTGATSSSPTTIGTTSQMLPTPITLATPASDAGSATQGGALPNITTTQAQATSIPQFYQDYLNNIATQGATNLGNMAYSGPTTNQNAAFSGVQAAGQGFQPGLTQAGQTTQGALSLNGANAAQPYLAQGTQASTQDINQYMNPYTKNVVDQIGLLNQQNIANTLSPAITSGAVGSGQFGSQRGAQALAGGIATADIAALAQQAAAEQSGYGQALTAAQQQRANQLAAGQTLGSLTNTQQANQLAGAQQQAAMAQQQQTDALAAINANATIGAQEQALNQAKVNYPMTALQQYGSLLQGQTIPTATSGTYTGPIPGAYSASPLATATGTAAALTGILNSGADAASKIQKITDFFKTSSP